MPILVLDRIFEFAVALSSASRLFVMSQIARHPDLSWRSQPSKRAVEWLHDYSDYFERSPGRAYTWRLSAKGRRYAGVTWKPVSGMSQKAEHWLGLGDIWMDLTFNGGRPERWITEHHRAFDVYFTWRGNPYLLEYQRTPITTRQWEAKWKQRIEWYKAQRFDVKPRVVLVNTTGQQDETICLPKGTIHVRRIDQLHHALRRPPQK